MMYGQRREKHRKYSFETLCVETIVEMLSRFASINIEWDSAALWAFILDLLCSYGFNYFYIIILCL